MAIEHATIPSFGTEERILCGQKRAIVAPTGRSGTVLLDLLIKLKMTVASGGGMVSWRDFFNQVEFSSTKGGVIFEGAWDGEALYTNSREFGNDGDAQNETADTTDIINDQFIHECIPLNYIVGKDEVLTMNLRVPTAFPVGGTIDIVNSFVQARLGIENRGDDIPIRVRYYCEDYVNGPTGVVTIPAGKKSPVTLQPPSKYGSLSRVGLYLHGVNPELAYNYNLVKNSVNVINGSGPYHARRILSKDKIPNEDGRLIVKCAGHPVADKDQLTIEAPEDQAIVIKRIIQKFIERVVVPADETDKPVNKKG